ncbi:antimicrobial peptide NK-lysin-like [Phoenicopterus ruber ruber]
MAAAFLLVLVVAVVPEPCQGGPESWCRDVATASRCGREQLCRDLWDSLALWDDAEGAAAVPGRGKNCSSCIKILELIKATVGDDPDEAALRKVCQALRNRLRNTCQRLVKKYRDQISEAVKNGDTPQATCTAIGLCMA